MQLNSQISTGHSQVLSANTKDSKYEYGVLTSLQNVNFFQSLKTKSNWALTGTDDFEAWF